MEKCPYSLGQCNFGRDGAIAIADALKVNVALTALDIGT